MDNNNNDSTQFKGEDIQRYVSGQMSAQEMHAMEKAALEDPFLADAIEGYKEKQETGESNILPHLEELHHRLKTRVENEESKTPVIVRSWWRIAAVLVLLAGCGALAYRLLNNSQENRKSSVVKNESIMSGDTLAEQLAPAKTFTTVDSTSVALNDGSPEAKRQEKFSLKSKSRSGNPMIPSQSDPVPSSPLLIQRLDSSLARNSEKDIASAPVMKKEFEKSATVENSMAMRSINKEAPANFFSGKVVSEENEPVAGATVRVQGKNEMLLATDSNGYFKFALPDTTASVAVNAIGFQTAKTTINSNLSDSRIRLKENKDALDEVVVVGYGENKRTRLSQDQKGKSQDAVPEIGFIEYNKYIEKNKRTDAIENNLRGDVIVSFRVNIDGSLSDFKIKKSISKSTDMEAIRLLKEGPAWKPSRNKNTQVEYTIRF